MTTNVIPEGVNETPVGGGSNGSVEKQNPRLVDGMVYLLVKAKLVADFVHFFRRPDDLNVDFEFFVEARAKFSVHTELRILDPYASGQTPFTKAGCSVMFPMPSMEVAAQKAASFRKKYIYGDPNESLFILARYRADLGVVYPDGTRARTFIAMPGLVAASFEEIVERYQAWKAKQVGGAETAKAEEAEPAIPAPEPEGPTPTKRKRGRPRKA